MATAAISIAMLFYVNTVYENKELNETKFNVLGKLRGLPTEVGYTNKKLDNNQSPTE